MNLTEKSQVLSNRPSTETCLFAAICCIIFIIVGCIGNSMTILALVKCRRLQNATTAFVVSLAVSDFLFCVVCLPLTATRYIYEEWILGEELCKLFPFFFYGNVAASLMSMTAITFNRFVLINCYSVYSTIYKKINVTAMIIICWAFSYVILVPTLIGVWGRFGYDKASFSCTILRNVDGKSPKKFLFSFGFLLPTITIIICYSCIFYKVRQSTLKLLSYTPDSRSKRNSSFLPKKREEIRITCTMLTSFCTFQLCFLPLMIVNVFEENIGYPILHTCASILAWMSACTNPFIYALLNKPYRDAYLQLLYDWKLLRANRTMSCDGCSDASKISQLKTICGDNSKTSELNISKDI
ncbi:Protein trapped in endoderm-1, partial [Stegodyphus mimosarum]